MSPANTLISFLLLFLSMVYNSYSQGCCGIGGSLVSGGHPVLDKNTFLATASLNYAEAANPERHRGSVGAMVAYGITDRFSLSLKTSFVRATASIYRSEIIVPGVDTIPEKMVPYKNTNFGDGFAALQFALIKMTPMNKHELISGVDVGLPWGQDRKMVDGVIQPGNVQTGTGGFSLNGFVTYLKAFPSIHFSVASTIAGRINFITRSEKDPGDEFSVLLTSLFGPFSYFRPSLTLSYYQNGLTYNKFDLAELGTNGKRFSIVPALEFSPVSTIKMALSGDIPLLQDKNQRLYGNNKVIKGEVYWFIH